MALLCSFFLNRVSLSSHGCDAVRCAPRNGLACSQLPRKCRALSRSVRFGPGTTKHLASRSCTYKRDSHCSGASSGRINHSHSYSDIGNNKTNSRSFYLDSNSTNDDGGLSQIILLLFLCLFLLTLPWASEHPAILLFPVLLSAVPGIGPAFMQPLAKEAFTWLVVGSKWLFAAVSQKRSSSSMAAHILHKSTMPQSPSHSRGADYHSKTPPHAGHHVHGNEQGHMPSRHVHDSEQGHARSSHRHAHEQNRVHSHHGHASESGHGHSSHAHANDVGDAQGRRNSHGHNKEHSGRRSIDLMSNLEQL